MKVETWRIGFPRCVANQLDLPVKPAHLPIGTDDPIFARRQYLTQFQSAPVVQDTGTVFRVNDRNEALERHVVVVRQAEQAKKLVGPDSGSGGDIDFDTADLSNLLRQGKMLLRDTQLFVAPTQFGSGRVRDP